MIALLCAVPIEVELLHTHVASTKTLQYGCLSVTQGTLADTKLVLCAGGLGKVNAAHAATILLTHFQPEALLIFGVGGAYPSSGALVGDIALASEEIAGDEGVFTSGGFQGTESMGIPLLKTDSETIFSRYRASKELLEQSHKVLASRRGTGRIHVGSFVTLSTCTGTAARARELEARYRGLCENMEGAAAAHVAAHHNIPWFEVRGISNIVEDRDMNKWNIPKAAEAAQYAVMHILQECRL